MYRRMGFVLVAILAMFVASGCGILSPEKPNKVSSRSKTPQSPALSKAAHSTSSFSDLQVTNVTLDALSTASILASWDVYDDTYVYGFYVAIREGSLTPDCYYDGKNVGYVFSNTFSSLKANTLYTVSVCAYDNDGYYGEERTASIYTLELPPPNPYSLDVSAITPNSLHFTWYSGGLNTDGFYFNYRKGIDFSVDCTAGYDTGFTTYFDLNGLQPNTPYTVAVCAYNNSGDVSAAAYRVGYTSEDYPPTPSSLTLVTTSRTSLKATWTSGGGTTNGFYLKLTEGSSAGKCQDGSDLGFSNSKDFFGLKEGTTYTASLCAYNSDDFISNSRTASSATWDGQPTTPGNVALNPYYQGALKLSWSPGSFNRSYYVALKQGNQVSIDCKTGTLRPSSTEFLFSSLTPDTYYTAAICAVNAQNEFTSQVVVSTKTLAPPPPAPLNAVAKAEDEDRIEVKWTSGGGNTSGFRVKIGRTSDVYCEANGDIGGATSASFTGLTVATTYTVVLCAYNSEGTTSNSLRFTITTPILPPAELSSLTVSNLELNTLQLNWTSSMVRTDAFQVAINKGDTAPINCTSGLTVLNTAYVGKKLTLPITLLEPNTDYSFRVCAFHLAQFSPGLTVTATTKSLTPFAKDEIYANGLYNDVLGRDLSWPEYFSGTVVRRYDNFAHRLRFALSILASDSFRIQGVKTIFQKHLKREAAESEWILFTNAWKASGKKESVLTAVLSSDEYYNRNGGNSTGFISALHQDLYSRSATTIEIDALKLSLSSGKTRTEIANQLLSSDELTNALVDVWYLKYLGRPADPAGKAHWRSRIVSIGQEKTEAELMASDECLSRQLRLSINPLYVEILGRNADPGVGYWINLLLNRGRRYDVAIGIFASEEHRGNVINSFYQKYLGRPAEPNGISYWKGVWSREGQDSVQSQIAASNEYFNKSGGTNESFIKALYIDFLGRPADPNGIQHWTTLLQSGATTRSKVTLQILQSMEGASQRVALWYKKYLNRNASPSEVEGWAIQLLKSTPEAIQAGFLDSVEYMFMKR